MRIVLTILFSAGVLLGIGSAIHHHRQHHGCAPHGAWHREQPK